MTVAPPSNPAFLTGPRSNVEHSNSSYIGTSVGCAFGFSARDTTSREDLVNIDLDDQLEPDQVLMARGQFIPRGQYQETNLLLESISGGFAGSDVRVFKGDQNVWGVGLGANASTPFDDPFNSSTRPNNPLANTPWVNPFTRKRIPKTFVRSG